MPQPVRLVDHISGPGIPMRDGVSMRDGVPMQTIVEGSIPSGAPMPPGTISRGMATPMDGQVVLGPIHEGDVFYQGLPGPTCGCESLACDGACDSACGIDACDGLANCCNQSDCSMCGELASPNAWRPCLTLCLPQDGWISAEYLAWWQSGMDLPPLVTTSTDPNVARNQAGVLGAPTTAILFGGNEILDDTTDGVRIRGGVWLDKFHTWGLGGEYFRIGSESESFTASSGGNPILARPLVNLLGMPAANDSELVAYPNILSGTVGVTATSELQGYGINLRYLANCNEGCSRTLFSSCPEKYCSRTEFLVGYRGLNLDESVMITEDLESLETNAPGGFDIFDRFDVSNEFNGFDVGWSYRRTRGFWTFDMLLRIAFGNTNQRVNIAGGTTITDPTSTPTNQVFNGGILAAASNIGRYQQDQFSVVPEFGANIGYQLTDHLRVTAGYTFIYWSNVVRPGDQIDLDVNPELFPPAISPLTGLARPAFDFDTTDYWVQGLSVGGEYRF